MPHVDVLKGGFFHSSSCHACLGQASVSLGAPRMPTNLLHHGSHNRIQKPVETGARKGPRLYSIQGALRVRSVLLFQASSSLGAVGHPCSACCFQTVSNAIELAMIASSTALMQACKRGARNQQGIEGTNVLR